MEKILVFLNQNFADFVMETISIFLGFLSAFFTQLFLDARKDRKTKKNVLRGIKSELNKIISILNELTEDDFGLDLYDKPYWESIVSTGQVELLVSEPYYEELVRVYHKITTANSWEGLNSQVCLTNGRINPMVIKKVIGTRQALIQDIQRLLLSLS